MKISEVRVKTVDGKKGKLKGWASITFDGEFVVHNLKIIEGQKGVFVAMPNRKTKDGEYRDTAHPLNNEMRKNIERAVIEEYNKIAAEQK